MRINKTSVTCRYKYSHSICCTLLSSTTPLIFSLKIGNMNRKWKMEVPMCHSRDTWTSLVFLYLQSWVGAVKLVPVTEVTLIRLTSLAEWKTKKSIDTGFLVYWALINKSTNIASWVWLFSMVKNLEDKQILAHCILLGYCFTGHCLIEARMLLQVKEIKRHFI